MSSVLVRIGLGAVLAAAAMFVWGFTFWMVLPFSQGMVRQVDQEEALTAALTAAVKESGSYFLPHPGAMQAANDPAAQEAFLARHRSGPLVQIIYRKEGLEPMNASMFLQGYLHMFVSALLAGGLLYLVAPALGGYAKRALFVAGLGVFATVALTFGNPIWFHHPWGFALGMGFHDTVAWCLAGSVLAAFVKAPAGALPLAVQPPHLQASGVRVA